ncbi:MAG TPA: DnaB-like helicase N-terminal domain-containing protein [Candidatus Binataceae bacterium]|nr:DnaB-like helicase N-terminal domain-containing protein [Candidatus Binataceae bacterium]
MSAGSVDRDFRSQVQTYDLDAEQSVLGAVLLDNEALKHAVENLRSDDFYRDAHREIFRAMVELADRNRPIDAITLANALTTKTLLETIGGGAYIAELAACVPTAANIAHYARIVRDKAVLRRLASIGIDIANHTYNAGGDANGIIDSALDRIAGLRRSQPAAAVLGTIASDVRERPVDWLWLGYIPRGTLVVFEGDPGKGKSTLITTLAANVSRGRALPGGSACPAGSVVLISAEDSPEQTIVPRLRAADANLARVRIVGPLLEKKGAALNILSLPKHVELIEKTVSAEGAILVAIDPFNAFLGEQIDSHRDHDIRRALAPLAAMAERTGAAVIVVRHLNKSGGENPLYRGGGSIGITATARVTFLVANDPKDAGRRILACIKNNLAPVPPSRAFRLVQAEGDQVAHVEWIAGDVALSAADLLAEEPKPRGPKPDKLETAKALIQGLLSDGREHPAADLDRTAKSAGISHGHLMNARSELGVVTRRQDFGGRGAWFVSLPNPDSMPTEPENSDSMRNPLPDKDFAKSQDPNSMTKTPIESEFQKGSEVARGTHQEEAEIERLAAADDEGLIE